MTPHPLDGLLSPRTVAVVGASDERDSVGQVVFENLLHGFAGELHAVNNARTTVQGRPSVETRCTS